jgi:outer membrane lipoprotein carrier protein
MMVRSFTFLFAFALVTGACGRDPQPASEPQPAPAAPAAVLDTAAVAEPVTGSAAEGPVAGTDAPTVPGPAAPGAPRPAAPGSDVTTPVPRQPQPQTPPQSDAQAQDGAAVLRRAAAAYEGVRAMQADFVMRAENPLLRTSVTSRGTIYQRQPDRIAVRFTEPDGDLIVGDGQYFWVYYPSNNPQQVIRAPAAAAGESAVNLQAQFIGNPVERFNYTHEGTESVGGRSAHVLLLVPRQRAEYRSLKVWLDDRDALARRFEITEHNGAVKRFDLTGLQVNPSIPDGVFRFTPPAGANIVTPR